jgi:hypothetical protein
MGGDSQIQRGGCGPLLTLMLISPSSHLAGLGDQQSRTHGNETLNDRANIMCVASLLLERILSPLPINNLLNVPSSKLLCTTLTVSSLISSHLIFSGHVRPCWLLSLGSATGSLGRITPNWRFSRFVPL